MKTLRIPWCMELVLVRTEKMTGCRFEPEGSTQDHTFMALLSEKRTVHPYDFVIFDYQLPQYTQLYRPQYA